MIRLNSLSMSRFRGVGEGTIHGLTDVNLLIGRNNSGKSTVLEAIMRLAFRKTGRDGDLFGRKMLELWGQVRNENNECPPELWYRLDHSQKIAIEAGLGFGEPKGKDKLAAVALRIEGEPSNLRVKPTGSFSGGGPNENQVGSFLAGVTLFRPSDALNRNIENRCWPQLLATRRDKALTKSLNEIFGLEAEGFQLLPDNRLMILFEEHSLPLDVHGDGTRTAMRALVVLTMLKGTLFLMEEPEAHQHPGSLERFAQALCRQAHEQEVQLLIATHSAECVRAFLTAAHAAGSGSAVFHLSLANGLQEARRLDAEAVETLQSTGVDVRFLDLYA